MKVNFYAMLRPIAGQKSVEFSMPEEVTIQELLEAILIRFPTMRSMLVDEQGQLHGHIHLFINGRDIPYLEKMAETPIKATDKIDIFPAIGGG